MLALIKTLRPACSVSPPPFPSKLLVIIAESTVISLLACNTTLVPVLVTAVMVLGAIVTDCKGLPSKLKPASVPWG